MKGSDPQHRSHATAINLSAVFMTLCAFQCKYLQYAANSKLRYLENLMVNIQARKMLKYRCCSIKTSKFIGMLAGVLQSKTLIIYTSNAANIRGDK